MSGFIMASRLMRPPSSLPSIGSLQTDAKSPYRALFAWVKEVEFIDDLSVRLHAHRPVPSLLDVLTRLHVLPPRYFAEVGDEQIR